MSLYDVPITNISGVGQERAKLFHKLNIHSIGQLIRFYPRSYEDWSQITDICDVVDGSKVVIKARVSSEITNAYISQGRLISRTTISDDTGTMSIVFFNNKYISSMLKQGEEYYFMGKATVNNKTTQIISPEFSKKNGHSSIEPIYKLTTNLSNRIVVKAVKEALSMLPNDMRDTVPYEILHKYNLCSLEFALRNIHFPKDFEAQERARRRLVFDELLILNLGMRFLRVRNRLKTPIRLQNDYTREFISSLPYELTSAQMRAIEDCVRDMKDNQFPMNRLVQGDVGSGKTAVAACVSFNTVKNGYQVAFMAPTEILAEQHYQNFIKMFDRFNIRVEILTGAMTGSEKKKVRSKLENGEIDIIIGTHTLITESTKFLKLGCAITDEQHRFGVEQRAKLSEKGEFPHVLVLSATPIPRTLGLIIYGDLDISIIDELPPGRKPCKTYLINSSKREDALGFIRKNIDKGRQAYIVCPLVDFGETDALDVNSYAEELMRSGFENYPIGILHGKMKSKDKEQVMKKFANNEISLLISTTVIEVGVDVKNAVIMMIENAENFGLSQLHQLRGRVGRGSEEAYCILVSDKFNEETKRRLSTMVKTTNGFEIADEDLKLRGPGDFFGNKQHGLPELKIADLSDMDSLKISQLASQDIIKDSPNLEGESVKGLRAEIRLLYSNISDYSFN